MKNLYCPGCQPEVDPAVPQDLCEEHYREMMREWPDDLLPIEELEDILERIYADSAVPKQSW